jgi:valyl-tRNA synthetase
VNNWDSPAADFIIPKMQEMIEAIRRVRNEHKVDAKKLVTVSIRASSDACRTIQNNREVIELLAIAKLKAVDADLAEVAGAAKTQAAGCEIFVEGAVDEGAEQQRTAKRREELTRQIDQMKKRLSHEGYIAKAPAHLVQQTKDQLAAAEAELKKLEE